MKNKGFAGCFVHHANKGGNSKGSSGSSTIGRLLDTSIQLTKLENDYRFDMPGLRQKILKNFQFEVLAVFYFYRPDTDMDTLKVFQESIDAENLEVAGLYNSSKTKKVNGSDNVDAEIVKDLGDESPEKVLAS